ncbi:hypothetical protein [Nocardiopsis sp. CC223A]|uniref:hypothetical protein n=1 Tax=Nocardiopsis sp. CC223A TaxID=3044051 RepID=UPI00279540A3|nr:hypothetical protein [Nocardiopsis sp. CC223A]
MGAAPATAQNLPRETDTSVALDACIEEAQSRELDSWLCLGGRLTTPDGSGITPDETEESGPPAETIEQDEVAVSPLTNSGLAADDYDAWCENASICHRRVTAYVDETKGNAAYGNANGVHGRFDLVIRTRMNGRSPNWSTAFIWEDGPMLSFHQARVQCREEEPLFPDTDCGMFMVDMELGEFEIFAGAANYRRDFGPIRSNYLEDASLYYANVEAYVWVEGIGPMGMPTLTTRKFECPTGDGNCSWLPE